MKETRNTKPASAKKRAARLISHYVEVANLQPGLLTDAEAQDLLSSFQTDAEIRTYKRMLQAEETLRYFLTYVELKHSYFFASVRDRGAVVNEIAAAVSTSALLHEIIGIVKDNELRSQIYAAIRQHRTVTEYHLASAEKKSDFSGFQKLKVVNDELLESAIRLKTAIQLAKNHIKRHGLDIPSYREKINLLEDSLDILNLEDIPDSLEPGLRWDFKGPTIDMVKVDQELYDTWARLSFPEYE